MHAYIHTRTHIHTRAHARTHTHTHRCTTIAQLPSTLSQKAKDIEQGWDELWSFLNKPYLSQWTKIRTRVLRVLDSDTKICLPLLQISPNSTLQHRTWMQHTWCDHVQLHTLHYTKTGYIHTCTTFVCSLVISMTVRKFLNKSLQNLVCYYV